jgi:hypothetical protein
MAVLSAERGGDPARPGKKDPLDALVWLAARPGEPSWASSFGPGRPGWHVECAAIATEYLSRVFDVQAGGSDLIFPHHEMSASHARVALGDGLHARGEGGVRAFARHYLHAGMVGLDGEKMSKSLGNLVFVSSLLADGTDPMAIRLAILAHHYRDDWDWTAAGLAAAEERLARWRAAMGRLLASSPEPEFQPAHRTPRPSLACRTRRPSPARWRRRRPCWPPCASGWPTTWTRREPSPRSTAGRTRSSAHRSCRRMRARRRCSSGTPRTPSWASASEGHPRRPLSEGHPLKAGQRPGRLLPAAG